MKWVNIVLLIMTCLVHVIHAQMRLSADPFNDEYKKYAKIASDYRDKKEYRLAADNYLTAIRANNGNGYNVADGVKLAGCWARCGYSDSAFNWLSKLERARYTKFNEIQLNEDFTSLHGDPRWKMTTDFISSNRFKYNPDYDPSLVQKLDSILQDDQKYRRREDEIKVKYGENSDEIKALYRTIEFHDSINVIKVSRILENYSWPPQNKIGSEGETTLFLVIQHADVKTQEEYFSAIKSAVDNNYIPRSFLAMLEDRIAVSHGKKQIYGTQVVADKKGKYKVEPIEDPDNVDQRRKEVGLGPLAEYLKEWNIVWPPEK